MSAAAARAKRKPRTIQERIAELQARAAAAKRRNDLRETIAQARRELQALGNKGKK